MAPAKPRSKAPIIITIVVAVLIIAAAVVLLILKPWESSGGKSSDDGKIEGSGVAQDAVTAFIKLDVDSILDLFPDEFYEALGDELDMSKREAKKYFGETLEDAVDEAVYDPDDVKLKISVTGEDSYKKSELNEIQDAYDELNVELDDAKIVLLDVTITLDGEKEKLEDIEVPIIKVGKNWYLDAYNVEDFTDQFANRVR